ncbi:hypothetical protein PoB_003079900 [Plakobranchus ocellatus]|uniref:Uncharacterized protein n=1 Tax=Plakobranchus ocellatus TaxID=259542 RepID=A0AAV4A9F0_9GAST|nr:hypothetical protein PoB_003079900 [Plakobranchus ocellatus]
MAPQNRTRPAITPDPYSRLLHSLSPQTPFPARSSRYLEPLSIYTIFERLVSPPRGVSSRLRHTYHQPRPAVQSQTFNAPFCIDSNLPRPIPDMQSEADSDPICVDPHLPQPIPDMQSEADSDPICVDSHLPQPIPDMQSKADSDPIWIDSHLPRPIPDMQSEADSDSICIDSHLPRPIPDMQSEADNMQSEADSDPISIDFHLPQSIPDMQSEAVNDSICIRYPFLQATPVVRPRLNIDPHWLQQNAIPHGRLRMFVDTDWVQRVHFDENPLLSSTASAYSQQSEYPHLSQPLTQYQIRRCRGRNHQHHRHHLTTEQSQHHRHHLTSEQSQHHRSHSRGVRNHPYEEVIIQNQWGDQQDASAMHSDFHRHRRNHRHCHRYGDHHQSGQSQSDNWQGPLDLSAHTDLNHWRDQQDASAMHSDFHRHRRNHSYRHRYGDHHQSGQSQSNYWQGPLDLSAHTDLDCLRDQQDASAMHSDFNCHRRNYRHCHRHGDHHQSGRAQSQSDNWQEPLDQSAHTELGISSSTNGDVFQQPSTIHEYMYLSQQPITTHGDLSRQPSTIHEYMYLSQQPITTHGDLFRQPSTIHEYMYLSQQPSTTHGDLSQQPSATYGDMSQQPSATYGDMSQQPSIYSGVPENEENLSLHGSATMMRLPDYRASSDPRALLGQFELLQEAMPTHQRVNSIEPDYAFNSDDENSDDENDDDRTAVMPLPDYGVSSDPHAHQFERHQEADTS